MAEEHAEASGSRPWAGSPALLARAERFLVSRLGCDPEEARQYPRGLVGPVPGSGTGSGAGAGADGPDRPDRPDRTADTSDPPAEAPPEASPESSAEPSSGAPSESPPRRRTATEGRPVVSPRRPGDVSVMRASMTGGPPSPPLAAPEVPDHQLRSLLSALDTDPQDDTCVIVLHVRKEA